jgi:alpha-glucoside transport system substrate-binding protein
MRSRLRSFTPFMVLALILAACGGGSSPTPGGGSGGTENLKDQSVTVIGTWTDTEQIAFLSMVQPWEKATGAHVKYTGTRSINDILAAGLRTNVLPDLAGIPGPGQMKEYSAAGKLKPLDDVLDVATYTKETSPGLVALGKIDGKTYGVFIKASVKGLIWFNPKLHDYTGKAPATWDDLMTQAQANKGNANAIWCLGLSSGADSGWPGTDWIEDILLHQAGPDVYNNWVAGKVKWTDPQIKAAFDLYMKDVVANTYGGGTNAINTKFDLAGDPLFASPPGCEFLHQASFITGLGKFAALKNPTDYNAFPFPSINDQFKTAVEGSGDLFAMFHDTPAAKSLMRYLVTAPAQDIWVKKGGALSANKNASDYTDELSKTMAALITSATQFVFDASDQMPNAMNAAFKAQMVTLAKGSETVDQALQALQKVADDAYSSS